MQAVDVLMITYNRPAYTRLALSRLLETCDENVRVWLWHNGDDAATLDTVRSLSSHPRVHQFHHSRENQRLREPTNWLWRNASGDLLAKVDDDCLMPLGWAQTLRRIHLDVLRLGVVGCWSYMEEDFDPGIAGHKMIDLAGGHRLLKNLWVGGSGYVMKRQCVAQQGLLAPEQSFTNYCIRLAARGWINGWHFPFLLQEHMDDPRAPNTLLKCDADMALHAPLSARTFGVTSLKRWEQALRTDACWVQQASLNWREYIGMSAWLRRMGSKIFNLATGAEPAAFGHRRTIAAAEKAN